MRRLGRDEDVLGFPNTSMRPRSVPHSIRSLRQDDRPSQATAFLMNVEQFYPQYNLVVLDEVGYRKSRCQLCRNNWDGNRHEVVGWGPATDGRNGQEEQDRYLACDDCVQYLANGEVPTDTQCQMCPRSAEILVHRSESGRAVVICCQCFYYAAVPFQEHALVMRAEPPHCYQACSWRWQ